MCQGRDVVGVAGQAPGHEIELLFRRVLEGEELRVRIDQFLDRAVADVADVGFGLDAQAVGRLLEVEDGDRIAVEVAHEAHGRLGEDLGAAAKDADVVALTRPHHQAVGAEGDRLVVTVLGEVAQTQTLDEGLVDGQRSVHGGDEARICLI